MDGNGGDAHALWLSITENPRRGLSGSQLSTTPSYSLALDGRVPVCVCPASSDGSRAPAVEPLTALKLRSGPPSVHVCETTKQAWSDNRGAPRESPRRRPLYQVHILLSPTSASRLLSFLPSSTTSIPFCFTQIRQTKPRLCPIFLSLYRIFAVHSTSGSVEPRKKKKKNYYEETDPTNQTTQISTDRGIEPRSHSRQDVCQSPQLDSPPVRRSPLLSRFWRSIGLSPDPVKAEA